MYNWFSVSNRNSYNLFGTTSSASSRTGFSSSLLSDWSMLKNGTYYKLAKSYYAKNQVSSDNSANKTEKTALSTAKGNATALKKAADALAKTGTSSVFHTKTVVDEKTGHTSKEYDKDAIYDAVKSYVDSYNDVVKNTIASDTVSVLRTTANMTNVTKTHASMLSKVGINLKSDNTLSIDEDAFKQADMQQVKSLFEGSSSLAGRVSDYAEGISKLATNAISSIDKGTYKASGSYAVSALSVGSMYDSIF